MSNTHCDPSGNSNLLLHVGSDILKLLFMDECFIFYHVQYILRFDRVTYVAFFFKLILSRR